MRYPEAGTGTRRLPGALVLGKTEASEALMKGGAIRRTKLERGENPPGLKKKKVKRGADARDRGPEHFISRKSF